MTERRTVRLKMLNDAEQALTEAASFAAGLPDSCKEEQQALEHLAEAQQAVLQIAKLLGEPNEW